MAHSREYEIIDYPQECRHAGVPYFVHRYSIFPKDTPHCGGACAVYGVAHNILDLEDAEKMVAGLEGRIYVPVTVHTVAD